MEELGAVDTNILAYSEGLVVAQGDRFKVSTCVALLSRLTRIKGRCVVPAQVLVELHNLLIRKRRLDREQAARRIHQIASNTIVVPTTADLLHTAYDLAARHKIGTFDSIILASAAEARCETLYSEDLQPGFVWRGVKIVNPLA